YGPWYHPWCDLRCSGDRTMAVRCRNCDVHGLDQLESIPLIIYYTEKTIDTLSLMLDALREQRRHIMSECSTPGLHTQHDPKDPERGDLDEHGNCRSLSRVD